MSLFPRAARPVREHRPAVSRRLLLAAAVLMPAALLPGAASAAPERGALVIEGRGGTTVEWVLGDDDLLTLGSPVPTLAGGGPYAGVLLEALDGSAADRTGAVQVRAFADRTRDVVAVFGSDVQLEPGRYRVTLLGQGPVRARYPLADRERDGLQITTRSRIPVTFLGRSEQLPLGQSSARVELPRSAAAGKRVLQVGLLDGTAVDDMRMCATDGGSCDNVAPVCPPAAPCQDPGSRRPRVGRGGPSAVAQLYPAALVARTLIWSASGYRLEDDRLRAAAIVF